MSMTEHRLKLRNGRSIKIAAPTYQEAVALAEKDGHRLEGPADIARELKGFLADAVGDMANDMLSPAGGLVDDKWKVRIKEAKRDKVRDLTGWLADALYNDPEVLSDLLGDRLYDRCPDPNQKRQVLENLIAHGHSGLKAACEGLLKEQEDNLHVNPDSNRY